MNNEHWFFSNFYEGIKSILIVLLLFLVVEHAVVQLVFYVVNRRRKVFTLHFGVFVGWAIHFLRLETSGYEISARKVIFSWPPRVELRDVRIVCPMDVVKETSGAGHTLKSSFYSRFFRPSLIANFPPLEIRLVNTNVISGSKEIKMDITLIKVQNCLTKENIELTAYLHGFEEDSGLKLSSLAFSSDIGYQFSDDRLVFKKWSPNLNIDGLEYTVQNANLALETGSENNSKIMKGLQHWFRKMVSFTVQLENAILRLPDDMSLSIFNAVLSAKPNFRDNKYEDDKGHNLTFSLNTCEFSLGEKGILRIPIINFLFHADILSFFEEDFNPYSSVNSFTVNVIDPVYSTTFDQLLKWLKFSHSSSENGGKGFGGYLEKLPMCVKVVISNVYFVFNVDDNVQYILRFGHVNASNFSEQLRYKFRECVLDIVKPRIYYLRLENFNFSCKVNRGEKTLQGTIVSFNDWEFDLELDQGKVQKGRSSLQSVCFIVGNYEIVNSLINSYEHFMRNRLSMNSNSIAEPISFEFSLFVKNISVVFSLKGFLPNEIDTVEADSVNLSECDYNLILSIESLEYFVDCASKALEIGLVCLKKESKKLNIVKSNEIISTSEVVVEDYGGEMKVSLPEIKCEFDINLVWFFFLLKVSIFDRLLVTTSQDTNSANTRSVRSIFISKVIIVLLLPKSMDALVQITDLDYIPVETSLTCRTSSLLVKSVYISDLDVYVPILSFVSLKFTADRSGVYIVSADSVKIQTEYHFRFYKIIDNLVTFVKALKQMRVGFNDLHAYKKLHPKAETPVKLKKVNLRIESFLLCVNEDLFEKELGLIYKVGVAEQRERLEKLSILQNSAKLANSEEFFREKYEVLKNYFSKSWIARYKVAKREFHGRNARYVENSVSGYKYFTLSLNEQTNALKCTMKGLEVDLSPPSFPLSDCSDFIFEFGNGVPIDTEYTTLLPLNINLKSSMISFNIRDYPLPALLIPNCLISGDIVFAESLASLFARRSIFVPFCSLAENRYEDQDSIYGSHIIRTLTPIKTFMNLKCEVDSNTPTQISWGKSLQPGYQNVMLWFDFLTKPPMDPSPKLGFWDKFRLLVHGTLRFHWKGRSQLHLNIKGSNDPYSVADIGAGLTFAWSGDTQLILNDNSAPKSFLQINSSNFELGVRDFSTPNSFDKVIMKLKGDVRWTLGLKFEAGDISSIGFSPRVGNLKPHYEVELSHPNYIPVPSEHDSYQGFRSNFIHLAFGVHSENSVIGTNSVHLAPETFAHFLAWWRLFNTYTAGPIRQGPLFPDLLQNGKKFGKSLFTVKYQLSLQPLKITHIHRHPYSHSNSKENNNLAFTGLKASLGSLKLDLHQKRKKIILQNDILQTSRAKWKFEINVGELDFSDADIRVVFALFEQQAVEGLLEKNLGISSDTEDEAKKYGLDESSLKYADWFDKDDYSDLHQIPLESQVPMKFSVLPFISAPKITYFRDVHNKGLSLQYPFGDEDVHECYLGKTRPDITQRELIQKRAVQLKEQIDTLKSRIQILGDPSQADNNSSKANKDDELSFLKEALDYLNYSLLLINEILQDFNISDENEDDERKDNHTLDSEFYSKNNDCSASELLRINTVSSFRNLRNFTGLSSDSTFDTRFIFHNVLIKINKEIRDHLISYVDSISTKSLSRFFVKHKAIMLLDELLKNRFQKTFIMEPKLDPRVETATLSNKDTLAIFQDFVRRVSDGFGASDNYSVRFISPQIQITSKKENSKAILIASRDVELSIIDILATGVGEEANRDDDSSLMETRYCFTFSDSQFFILDKRNTTKWHELSTYLNSYGMENPSKSWPPWLPLEACYTTEFLQEHLFLEKNDIFIIFSRPNSLFFNEKKASLNQGEPRVHIGFPKLNLTSTSEQYSAIFNIVQDMVTFSSNKEKKMDKLARIFLAEEIKFNIGKLDSKLVESLQSKIRALKYLDSFTRFHDPHAYQKCSQDILVELHTTKLELYLLMSAIKQNHDRLQVKNKSKLVNRLLWDISADELVWELFDEAKKSFVVFGLGPFQYRRSESYYGSTSNMIDISTLQCFNIQDDCIYRELLGPYENHPKFDSSKSFIKISWNMGAPIGGISNLVELIFEAQPIIFKMDYKTSEKLMAFLFPKDGLAEALASNSNQHKNSRRSNSREDPRMGHQIASDLDELPISSPLTRRMVLSEWDVESFTKVLERANWRQNTKVMQTPDKDMNDMLIRSTKYFTVGDVIIRSLILSVSYKGSRSVITNVDNLIVKVPTIEYRNKVWSTEELISSLKKDIVKIIVQHMGYIIGNKFVPHKKEAKYEPLRQLTTVLRPDLNRAQTASTFSSKQLSKLPSKQSSKPTSQIQDIDKITNSSTEDERDISKYFPMYSDSQE